MSQPRMIAVLALMLACKKDRTKEFEEHAQKQLADKRALIAKLAVEHKPRLDAFREIVTSAKTLPPPTGLSGVAVDKVAPVVALDVAEWIIEPGKTMLADIYRYGADDRAGWVRALSAAARPDNSFNDNAEADFALLGAVKQIVVVKPIKISPPYATATGFNIGALAAHAYVFDVASKRALGGVAFVATSSSTIEFEYHQNDSDSERQRIRESAIKADFASQIAAALDKALGRAK